MSKIPGFQGTSKLKTPAFKSKLAVPGSFGLRGKCPEKVLTSGGAHDKPGEQDESCTKPIPGMLRTTTANGSGEDVKADGSTQTLDVNSHLQTKDSKESRTGMQAVKRGAGSSQPRCQTVAARGSNLHSQTPYAREAETISKFGGRKISGSSAGLRKPVPRVPKAVGRGENLVSKSRDQGNTSEVTKSIESRPACAADNATASTKCRIPSASKLSKKGSASLHNLNYMSAKQGEESYRRPWESSLSSSMSMQSLSQNSIEKKTSFNKSSCKLRKFASTENFPGDLSKQIERRSSTSNLASKQGSSKIRPKSGEQKTNIKNENANRDTDTLEVRKPSTLRIPTSRPLGRPLAGPKPRNSLQNAIVRSDKKGNKDAPDVSNSPAVIAEAVDYKRKAETIDCLRFSCANDKVETDSILGIIGPRQSTPLRKEAGCISLKAEHEKNESESSSSGPNSDNLRGHINLEKEGEAKPLSGGRHKTDSVLEKTFNVDIQDKESIQKEERSEVKSCLAERKHNATFSQDDQSLTGSVYQTVFFAHDDDLRDNNMHSTFCYEDQVDDLSYPALAVSEEGNSKRLHLSSIQSPRPRTNGNQSPCTFDLYHVSPPHEDVSSASLALSSLENVSLDDEVVVKSSIHDEKARVSESGINSKFFNYELCTNEYNKTDVQTLNHDHEVSEGKQRRTKENLDKRDVDFSPSQTTPPLPSADYVLPEKVGYDLKEKDLRPAEKIEGMKALRLDLYNGDIVDISDKVKSMTLPLTRSRRALTVDPAGISLSPRLKDGLGKRLNETLSAGVILKPPSRNLVMLEDATGNVTLDKWSYIQLQHEIKAMKTAVLKLKRCLQEVDIASPLGNSSLSFTLDHQHLPSDANRRSRLRPQSFSVGSNWTSRSLDVGPLYNVDGFKKETTEDHFGTPTADKQLEGGELIDRIIALEKMKDDLLLELDRKENTIRLLQMQLEGKHHLEERDELLEENIILHEEVSRLRRELNKINSTEQPQDLWKSSEKTDTSLQRDFAKQLRNQSPVKAGILKRMYSHE